MQPSLFPSDPPSGLAGLDYREELIDGEQEAALVRAIEGLDLKPFEFHGFLGNRRTAAFGSRYDFSRERVEAAPPIPDFLQALRTAAASFAGLEAATLEHVLVTEYAPGAGIGWHRDKPQYGQVIGVSLLAPCVLRFRRRTERGWDRRELALAPRSAYRLSGPVRDHWEHSITPMSVLRYSVTFRSRRQG